LAAAGGGQPELATAGGRFPDKIGEAFNTAEKWVKEQLT